MSDEEANGLGDGVRRAREAAGLTQQQLGEQSGKGRNYIAQLETGKITNPGIYTFFDIASVLGKRVEDLMNVPRVERLSTGRSRARRRIVRPIGDVIADVSARAATMKADPYEVPDGPDARVFVGTTGLRIDDLIRAGHDYAEKWAEYPGVSEQDSVAGALIFGIVCGAEYGMG